MVVTLPKLGFKFKLPLQRWILTGRTSGAPPLTDICDLQTAVTFCLPGYRFKETF